MTEYSITLPRGTNVHKPNLLDGHAKMTEDMKTALSAFDTDGEEGLSSNELLEAFNYFTNKEKEIAVTGKKGDGVITSKDIEQIVKTDSKFAKIREKYKNDNKVVDLLSNIVMTLSALVQNSEFTAYQIAPSGIKCIHDGKIRALNSEYAVDNVKSEIKIVDGKKVKICQNNKKEIYVMTENGKYIYTNPAYVAKCLGYETESTLFGLGADKYYQKGSVTHFLQIGKGGHDVSNEVKHYMIWNEDTNSFTCGETKYTGQRTHHIGTR